MPKPAPYITLLEQTMEMQAIWMPGVDLFVMATVNTKQNLGNWVRANY
jgi:hypothetical protein